MGKQKTKCKACKPQCVLHPYPNKISAETKELIAELQLEKISLAGIASVTKQLQDQVNKKYAERVKRCEKVRELDIKKASQSLIVEADESQCGATLRVFFKKSELK